MENMPPEKRRMTFIKEFPATEKVVGILLFQGKVILATERAVYKMTENETLEQIEIEYREAE